MTELTLESPGDHLFVRSIGERGIRIGDAWYTGSLILDAKTLNDEWPPVTPSDLIEDHFEPVFELEPEVVLLGTGARQVFPAPALLAGFYERGIGIEIMTTQAACRTFNVLVSEGRRAVAAMLPLNAE